VSPQVNEAFSLEETPTVGRGSSLGDKKRWRRKGL
jgi:hypothetical protein